MTEDRKGESAESKKDDASASSQKTQTRFNFYNAEDVNPKTETPATSEDPKRFNFYNAEEVNEASSHLATASASLPTPRKEKLSVAAPKVPPLPAQSAHVNAPSEFLRLNTTIPSTISKPSRKNTKKHNSFFTEPTPKSDVAVFDHDLDSSEILRSLQETERERQRQRSAQHTPRHSNGHHFAGKEETPVRQTERKRIPSKNISKNPYEDAIQDALQFLRQQHKPPPQDLPPPQSVVGRVVGGDSDDHGLDPIVGNRTSDKILQLRQDEEDHGTEIREIERRRRQERIAKYASRLVEMQKRPLLTPQSSASDLKSMQLSPMPPVNQDDVDSLFRRRTTSTPKDPALLTRSPTTDQSIHTATSSCDEEIQRGVERVLMAILERANSRGRGEQEDGLVKALESLLIRPSASFETVSTNRDRVHGPSRRVSQERHDDEEMTDLSSVTGTSFKRSVVDELLEEDEATIKSPQIEDEVETDEEYSENFLSKHKMALSRARHAMAQPDFITPSSTLVDLHASPQITTGSTFDILSENEDLDNGISGTVGDDDDDDIFSEDEDPQHDSLEESESTLNKVLGPLSKKAGGTTGVVLEPPEFPKLEDQLDSPTTAPTIFESLSSVVKDAEYFMSFISTALSQDEQRLKSLNNDKYSTHDDETDSPRVGHVKYDEDGDGLMRSLCAHLLPYGVDKSTKAVALERIPPWDETNPNEAGYRIIRLSKRQLGQVEREFERMVNGVKRNSERRLIGSDEGRRSDWNGVSDRVYDAGFERDLEEAEELLDQEEKRQEASNKSKNGGRKDSVKDGKGSDAKSLTDSASSDTDDVDRSQSPTLSADETTANCHPDFPGVRTTGKGEMGDLEFFNLPIIYKSHVTGFEPTKDLYLEPGNVVAGQYLVESELGSAAFSTAYRCIDLNSDARGEGDYHDEVCLKVIKNTKDFFDQSLDEIKILELLRQTGKCHEKFIVEMKTFFYHREHLVIVTELLRQNLFEFGKFIIDNDEEPYFILSRVCYITRQMLIALDFVHSLGLVHSDVKPENILLSSYSRAQVKLIDFGSSCYLTDRQSSYIQSRSYRAPEVVLGLPYDGKIDVWSLGCVVAEMYTGDVTFQNDSIVSMLSRIEAICGPFPRHMIAQGRQSSRFFTKSGLLYELVDGAGGEESSIKNPLDDDSPDALFDIFQPKGTTMQARLGLPTVIDDDEALFVDFCQKILTIDPDGRPTAAEALQHPWIVSGETLTEAEIKYPSN